MTVTIRIPSDPVTNGITVIQTSCFNPVSSHYSDVDYMAANFVIKNSGLKPPPMFPKNEDKTFMGWKVRNYLATEPIQYVDILAYKIWVDTANGPVYISDLAKLVSIPLTDIYIEEFNFYLDVQTDSVDGLEPTKWKSIRVDHPMPKNFRTAEQFGYEGVYRMILNALSLSFFHTAGQWPSTVPARRLAAGVKPW